jgi:hypothetical protein
MSTLARSGLRPASLPPGSARRPRLRRVSDGRCLEGEPRGLVRLALTDEELDPTLVIEPATPAGPAGPAGHRDDRSEVTLVLVDILDACGIDADDRARGSAQCVIDPESIAALTARFRSLPPTPSLSASLSRPDREGDPKGTIESIMAIGSIGVLSAE